LIYYDYYSDVPTRAVDDFVRAADMGRLVTAGSEDFPHIGLYPFVYLESTIEMHVNRKDGQLADLRMNPKCLFEIDEVLGTIPSYWVHPEDAVMATAYHRTVIFECAAVISEDASALAAQQTRIMARYQPQGGFRPVTANDPLYSGAIAHITALRLEIRRCRVKFKLGQNRSTDVRARIVEELRKRGRLMDERAADALQWTIEQEKGKQ